MFLFEFVAFTSAPFSINNSIISELPYSAAKCRGVVAISIGAVRTFRIRNKIDKKIHTNIKTLPFDIIHMYGDFQNEFTHEIPVEKKVKDVRYSLTFRKHLE